MEIPRSEISPTRQPMLQQRNREGKRSAMQSLQFKENAGTVPSMQPGPSLYLMMHSGGVEPCAASQCPRVPLVLDCSRKLLLATCSDTYRQLVTPLLVCVLHRRSPHRRSPRIPPVKGMLMSSTLMRAQRPTMVRM